MREKRIRVVSVIMAFIMILSQGVLVSAEEPEAGQENKAVISGQQDGAADHAESIDDADVSGDAGDAGKTVITEEKKTEEITVLDEDKTTGTDEDKTTGTDEDETTDTDEDQTVTEEEPVLEGAWVWSGNRWWYRYSDGSYPADGIYEIDGVDYAFDNAGWMVTGWYLEREGWYYFAGNGAKHTGWIQLKGTWYYLMNGNEDPQYPGRMAADCERKIGNAVYRFASGGAMVTGWVLQGNDWYYYVPSGARAEGGWQYINGAWYYFLDEAEDPQHPGRMAADCEKEIRNKIYRFTSGGAMVTGWVLQDNDWYYYVSSGAKVEGGWQYISGVWYYFLDEEEDPQHPGRMTADCEKKIGDKIYKFTSGGAMVTGWVQQGNDWYYYMPSGEKATGGWICAGNTWYYMNPDNGGKMVSSGWREIGGVYYFFHGSGAMATGWLYNNGEWYYLNGSGAMATGWIALGENWYYLYTKDDPRGGSYGAMAKDTTIDGYVIAPNGAYNSAYQTAYGMLNRIGWDLRAAFNWSTNLTYTEMVVNPGLGSAWYANYGYQNGKGNCYVMAASFYHMAILLGYDAHQIAGNVQTRNGMSPHSWVEIVINGTTYVFDPSFAGGNRRNGYQITYGASGTFRYTHYYRMN